MLDTTRVTCSNLLYSALQYIFIMQSTLMSLFFSWQADSQQWLHQIKIHLEALVDTFVLKPVMDTLSSSGINLFRVISFFSAGESYLVDFRTKTNTNLLSQITELLR